MKIMLIAAKSDNNVLGYQGDLPWHLPGDLAFFEAQIKTGFLLTGRTSYASPQGQEVFANRSDLVVVTRQKDFKIEHGFVAYDIESAFAIAKRSLLAHVILSPFFTVILNPFFTVILSPRSPDDFRQGKGEGSIL
jgi:dihydrofolate reductase